MTFQVHKLLKQTLHKLKNSLRKENLRLEHELFSIFFYLSATAVILKAAGGVRRVLDKVLKIQPTNNKYFKRQNLPQTNNSILNNKHKTNKKSERKIIEIFCILIQKLKYTHDANN